MAGGDFATKFFCINMNERHFYHYLRQGGNVFARLCLSVCLSVCLCVCKITQKVMDGSF